MRELDALLMQYMDRQYAGSSQVERATFQYFLTLPDPDILALLTGRASSDDTAIQRLVGEIRAQRLPRDPDTHSAAD